MLLIRFLIISICVLYIIRSLIRFALPFLFQGIINKAQQQNAHKQQQKPTGKIKVDFMPPAQKNKVPDSEGDFVDYEEVK